MKDQACKDVPATPTGEMFHNPPTSYQVANYAIGLENPIDDIESLKSFFSASIMLKIPRLSSLLVKYPNGKHYWRRTKVNIDDHFVVRRLIDDGTPKTDESGYEDLINNYLAELATAPPMSLERPLWEVHALVDVRCLVLRLHHSIGDGASLTSVIREIGISDRRRRNEREKVINKAAMITSKVQHWRWNKGEGLLGLARYVWFSTVFGFQSGVKTFLVKDKKTALKGKSVYSYYRPQKVATARFNLDDVKLVRKAIPNSTLNDVLCGIIWGGIMKYIEARSSSGDVAAPKEGQQITGVLMANLRRVTGLQELSTMEGRSLDKWWGNNTGVFLLPMKYTKRAEDVLSYVKKCKSILDKKKRSLEPRSSLQWIKMAFRLFGVKAASYLITKLGENTTFGFSNIVGPSEKMIIAGNPVTYLKATLSSAPLGIVMHLLSYMKDLNLQILAAEDIIPDPKLLASCFEETFQQMMDAVKEGSIV